MSPYLTLRRWPEFFLILSLGVVTQFLDNLAVPQLFGAPLNRPVFVFNLLPLLVAGSILALLSSSWDERYEAASTARSLRKEKATLLGSATAAWTAVFGFGLFIGVVPIHSVSTIFFCLAAVGLVLALRSRLSSKASAGIALPLSLLAPLFPWYVGETTPLGNSLGQGMSPIVAIVCAALFVAGAAAWLHRRH
ncbi:hypothetical protein [Corynebacterium singulare]|uniref:Uncharacterized protein n=1 Tax=Corynebacterium singulare TaxID=161899 RepID=A0A0B6EYL7_9CORY|nr:hypothetical protein [Corynebacterium singulare]AJI78024.1 hypothetical protein CSING_02350 [Corynebacterium singulare]